MMVLFIFLLDIVVLFIGIKIFTKNGIPFVKFLYVLLLLVVFVVSVFCYSIRINANRIHRGSKLFIKEIVGGTLTSTEISYDLEISAEEKLKIQNTIKDFPQLKYKIEFYEFWGDYWKYKLSFEDNQTYLIEIRVPYSFMSVFPRLDYQLSNVDTWRVDE